MSQSQTEAGGRSEERLAGGGEYAGRNLAALHSSTTAAQAFRRCVRRAGLLGAKSSSHVGSLSANSTMVSAVEEPGELRDGRPLFRIAAVLVAVGHAAAHGDHRMVFEAKPKRSDGRGSIEPEAVGL